MEIDFSQAVDGVIEVDVPRDVLPQGLLGTDSGALSADKFRRDVERQAKAAGYAVTRFAVRTGNARGCCVAEMRVSKGTDSSPGNPSVGDPSPRPSPRGEGDKRNA